MFEMFNITVFTTQQQDKYRYNKHVLILQH